MKEWKRCLSLLCIGTLLSASLSWAQHPSLGETLHQEKCVSCHQTKVAVGDGNQIYLRMDRKVQSYNKLVSQVSLCNTSLGLELFPEDEAAIVHYLNQRFYRFKQP